LKFENVEIHFRDTKYLKLVIHLKTILQSFVSAL